MIEEYGCGSLAVELEPRGIRENKVIHGEGLGIGKAWV